MLNSNEAGFDLFRSRSTLDDPPECDRCGKTLSRETALDRGEPADDGELVSVCAECAELE